MQKGDSRVINGWAFYDWANSVYPLVITSSVFPIYFSKTTENSALPEGLRDKVTFWGMQFINTELYAYTISASFLLIAMLSPVLSGIADYSGNKKRFMQVFCYLGALACMGMFFFTGSETLGWGLFVVFVASIGYSGSLVFYNAFLPEIVEPDQQDRVSARGFSMGYIGSFILLVVCLVLIQGHEYFGFENEGLPTRISFLVTGIWWIVFAQVSFARLPNNIFGRKPSGNVLTKGFKELRAVFAQLKKLPRLSRFLMAFFMYNAGVQTVMYMAAAFGEKTLQMETAELITTILIIQLVAILGAWGFARISERIGNIPTLRVAVLIWIGICVAAYFVQAGVQFYILGAVVGLVMGAIQSLSRSTYSKLLPDTQDHASFFSFFDVTEKLGYVVGIASFGLVESITENMRLSAFVLGAYFILGLIGLAFVPKYSAIQGRNG